MQEYPSIVQFFFTLEKFNDFRKEYFNPAQFDKGRGVFANLFNKNYIPPRTRYATFDEFLNMRLFKSTIPSSHQLVITPHLNMSISQMEKCLTRWSDTVKLFETTKSRIIEEKDLNLVDGQPSVLTIHRLVSPEEFSFLNNPGKDNIIKPKVSCLPLGYIWKFHKYETKEFLQTLAFFSVLAIAGVIGICVNEQPYTWIGAAVVGIFLAAIFGIIIHNIGTLIAKKSEYKYDWIPWITGLLTAALIFFSFNSVSIPDRAYNSAPTHFYNYSDSEEDDITVYTTEYGECYHSTPDCPTLSRSRNIYTTSKGRAKRNYRPCQKCH